MTFKSYPKKENTPARLTRKQARRSVFWYNYKLSKTLKKSKRRQEASQDE